MRAIWHFALHVKFDIVIIIKIYETQKIKNVYIWIIFAAQMSSLNVGKHVRRESLHNKFLFCATHIHIRKITMSIMAYVLPMIFYSFLRRNTSVYFYQIINVFIFNR